MRRTVSNVTLPEASSLARPAVSFSLGHLLRNQFLEQDALHMNRQRLLHISAYGPSTSISKLEAARRALRTASVMEPA